jgi:hypothetical protein
MRMLSLLLSAIVLLSPPAFATAPTGYLTVTAANVQDSTGTLLANGTVLFTPVYNSGSPITYRINGHGQAISTPVSTLVTNGGFSIQLADTALTAPANVCYAVTIRNNVTGKQILGPGYTCVQPSGSGTAVTGFNAWCSAATGSAGGSCDFDLYSPNSAALVTVQTGPTGSAPNIVGGTATGLINGQPPTVTVFGAKPNFIRNFGIPASPSVPVGALQGAWISTTNYSNGNVVTFSCNTYISLAPNNTGNEPDTHPTLWGLLTSLSNLPSAFTSQSQAGPAPGAFTTVCDFNGPLDVMVCFGAKGDGTTNDTAAIRAGIIYAAAHNLPLRIPDAAYSITPADTFTNEGGVTYMGAFPLQNNLDIEADRGATFRIANGVSSNATPVPMAMFYSNAALTNITIHNLTMDMNGQNNPISPNRASLSYNRFNQAQIIFTGSINGAGKLPTASGSNVRLEGDTFLNTPGTSCVVMEQSNETGAVLGSGWLLRKNVFNNNGLDTDDHSSVFGWANNVLVDGNTFNTDFVDGSTMPISGAPANGTAGPEVAYEIHGSNTRFVNNTVTGYLQGLWLADNLTSLVTQTVVANNTFHTLFFGASTFDQSTSEQGISGLMFTGNNCFFDDTPVTAVPGLNLKQCFTVPPSFAVTDFTASGNSMYKTGTTFASVFANIVGTDTAGQVTSRITITGNAAHGTSAGAEITAGSSGLGTIVDTDNQWIGLVPAGIATFATGDSITTASTGTIASLTLGGGSAINQVSQSNAFGILITPEAGTLTITNLTVHPTSFVGMGAGNYVEEGSVVVTNRLAAEGQGLSVTTLSVKSLSLGGGTRLTSLNAIPTSPASQQRSPFSRIMREARPILVSGD